MIKNIFIVEGLPGVGKSYFCEILQHEIQDKIKNKKIFFFEERDDDHPFHISEKDTANNIWSMDYKDCINIIENKCTNFFSNIYKTKEIYIFDCGLLQRPIFCSTIISDFSEEATFNHLLKLYKNYKNFPCQLFYLESRNYISDFESIYRNRGSDYRNSIEQFWNNSKYGIKKDLQGLDGAIEVLEYFKELKELFINKLNLLPTIVDNTNKKPDIIKNKIKNLLYLK
jgi:hypothetical protein